MTKYRTEIVLTHKDGARVVITVTGEEAEHTAHVANTIKEHYQTPAHWEQTDRMYRHEESMMRQWYDFARDFFHLR